MVYYYIWTAADADWNDGNPIKKIYLRKMDIKKKLNFRIRPSLPKYNNKLNEIAANKMRRIN